MHYFVNFVNNILNDESIVCLQTFNYLSFSAFSVCDVTTNVLERALKFILSVPIFCKLKIIYHGMWTMPWVNNVSIEAL